MLREGQFVYLLVEIYEVTPHTTTVEQLCRRVGFRRIIVHPRTEGRHHEREPGDIYSLSTAMTLLNSPTSPNCHTYPAQIKFVASLRTVDQPARCTVSVFKTPASDLPHLPRPMYSINELPNVPLLCSQDFAHRELPQPLSTRVATQGKLSMNTSTSAQHQMSNSLAELLGLEEDEEELPEVMILTPSPVIFGHDKSADDLPLVMPLSPCAEDLPVVIPLIHSPIRFVHGKSAEHLPPVMPLTPCTEELSLVMPLNPSPLRFVHEKSAEHLPLVRPLTPFAEDLTAITQRTPYTTRFAHEKSVVTSHVSEAQTVSLVERSEHKSSSLHEQHRVPQKELTASEQHRQLSSATRIETTSASTQDTLQLPSVKTSASYVRTEAQETVSFTAVQRLSQLPAGTRPDCAFVEAKKKKQKKKKGVKRKLRFVVKRTILDDLPVAIKTVPMVRRTF